MRQLRFVTLLAVPLAGAGSWLAHSASYRLVVPDPEQRTELLARTGHSYLDYAPGFLALVAALLTLALLLRVQARFRGEGAPRLLGWPFAFLPPVYFAAQEHLERLAHTGDIPWGAALEPTFLVGLLLQAPFALAAFAVARLLLGIADRVADSLEAGVPTPARAAAPALLIPLDSPLVRRAVLARGFGERAPPGLL